MAIPRRQVVLHQQVLTDSINALLNSEQDAEQWIARFEQDFAAYCGVKHAVAVASGRQGLRCILRALALKPGTKVMLPAYTYRAVPQALISEKLEPVFIDIRPTDHNMNLEMAAEALERCNVMLCTHLFGNPMEMDAVMELARQHNMVVIEDCAHALGALYKGQKTGTFGIAGFFSFGATKVFNTFGGGIVVTQSDELAAKIREQISQLMPLKQSKLLFKALLFTGLAAFTRPALFTWSLYPLLLGLAFFDKDILSLYERSGKRAAEAGISDTGFTEIQARWGLSGLKELDGLLEQRRYAFEQFDRLLVPEVQRLTPARNTEPSPYFFIILHPDRKNIQHELLLAGIDTGYHVMDDCAALFPSAGSFPVTVQARNQSIQAPVYPWFRESEFQRIAGCINKIVRRRGEKG